MAKLPRPRRQSLVPNPDWLEGRRLLSLAVAPVVSPLHAIVASPDHDDAREAVQVHAPVFRPNPSPVLRAEPAETDAVVEGRSGSPEPDDDPGIYPNAATVRLLDAPNFLVGSVFDASAGDTSINSFLRDDSGRHAEVYASTSAVGTTLHAYNPAPATAIRLGTEGDATDLPTAPRLTPPLRSIQIPATLAAAERSDNTRLGADLILHPLRVQVEQLTRELDEILERFDGLTGLDAFGAVATPRVVAFGTLCVAAVAACEVACRVHRRNSEKISGRVPSTAMVPGLWPARMS
jgi:hypothetical protein